MCRMDIPFVLSFWGCTSKSLFLSVPHHIDLIPHCFCRPLSALSYDLPHCFHIQTSDQKYWQASAPWSVLHVFPFSAGRFLLPLGPASSEEPSDSSQALYENFPEVLFPLPLPEKDYRSLPAPDPFHPMASQSRTKAVQIFYCGIPFPHILLVLLPLLPCQYPQEEVSGQTPSADTVSDLQSWLTDPHFFLPDMKNYFSDL